MGLNFRKSIKVGKNSRVNISKSGIGMSTGVKGARVGVNKRGTYVAGGKNGVYYRKNLGSNSDNSDQVLYNEKPSKGELFLIICSLIWNIIKVVFYGTLLFFIIKFMIFIIKM